MENRSSLRLLVGTLPGQPYERRQSITSRYSTCGQPCRTRPTDGCQQPTAQPELFRCPVPPPAHQIGRPQGHYRHGPPTCPTGVPHAQVWSTVRRQRHGVLRAEIPQPTSPVTSKEGGEARVAARAGPNVSQFLGRGCQEKTFPLSPLETCWWLTSSPAPFVEGFLVFAA